ncbi:MAG: hypothetical protein ABSB66_07700 [Candidatus Acidiferrales bacterium]|jgi:hypothetical protein
MRHALLIGSVLFMAMSANAQINVANTDGSFAQVSLATPSGNGFSIPALPASPAGITGIPAEVPTAVNADPPQYVQSVYENYRWQAYVGYEYLRFYEVPAITLNSNGFVYSLVYYLKDWIALDGELNATHLNELHTGGWLLMGAGGVRFRWSGPRGVELWGHALGGYSHLTPQTAYGNEHAPAFEAGGGMDINPNRRRIAYRVEADMVGTRYFGTYQYSPKVSVGIVIKF